jgi:hypothetical protein
MPSVVSKGRCDPWLGIMVEGGRVSMSSLDGKYYGLLTRAYESRILRGINPKGNSKDDQQGTLLVALIDDNVKLARRP